MIVKPKAPAPGESLPSVTNNPDVEKQWVVKAVRQSEAFISLVTSYKDHSKLRLTRVDDEIYILFRATFPNFQIDVVNETEMKSEEGKRLWAPFMMNFQYKVEMFNFLTMLRVDCKGDYSEQNTIVVPRIQFLCIEIARIREGYNKHITRDSQ